MHLAQFHPCRYSNLPRRTSSCFAPRGSLAFPTRYVLSHIHAPRGPTGRVNTYTVTLEERNNYSRELWSLVSSGTLRINIHSEYPFTADGVRQAQIDLTSGKTTGKLLIKVAD